MTDATGCGARRRYAGLLIALGGLLAGAAASAQVDPSVVPDELGEQDVARRYAVEFIVFTYAQTSGSEIFLPEQPADTGVTARGEVDAYGVPIAGDEPPVAEYGDLVGFTADAELEEVLSARSVDLQLMGPDERSMRPIWDKLERLDAYRPVMWSGWTQAVREESATPAIPLRRLGAAPLQLDGTLKLYLSRYLHLVVDLRLEDRGTAGAGDAVAGSPYGERSVRGDFMPEPALRYRIDEDRIVKSDDLRYFDHPKFGVVARITRVDEPPDDTTGDLLPGRRAPN